MNSHTLAALQRWQAAEADNKSAYETHTVSDLKSEIDKRNVDREDDAKLPVAGNKSDLIAALVADDATKES